MYSYYSSPASLSAQIWRLILNPPLNCSVCLKSDKILGVTIVGPDQTPYEGGCFQFEVNLESYPPKAKCLTKVFHPNISNGTGSVCMQMQEASFTLFQYVICLYSLFVNPYQFVDTGYGNKAKKTLKESKYAFDKKAKEKTKLYAIPKTS